MSDDTTLPPVVEKVKTKAQVVFEFAKLHWLWVGPLVGFALGKVL